MSRLLDNQEVSDELTEFIMSNNKLIEESQDRSMATPMGMPGVPIRGGGESTKQHSSFDDLNFASALQMFSSPSMQNSFPARGHTPVTNNPSILARTFSGESPTNKKTSSDSLLLMLGMDFQGTQGFSAPEGRKSFLGSCTSTPGVNAK